MNDSEISYIYKLPTGTIRTLYPVEIGCFVKLLRKSKNWKQCVLAHEAKTTERTIQRMESGEKISNPILIQVAAALGLSKEEFIKSRYIPTHDEMLMHIQNLVFEDGQHQFVDIEPINNEKCFKEILDSDAYTFDDQYLSDDIKEAVESFKDNLIDWKSIYETISNIEKLKTRELLLEQIYEIESMGYIIKFGTYLSTIKVLKTELKVAIIIFFRASDEADKITRVLCSKETTKITSAF